MERNKFVGDERPKRRDPRVNFYFYDGSGKRHKIRSKTKMELLVKYGIVDDDTPVFDKRFKVWTKACDVAVYQEVTGRQPSPKGHAPQSINRQAATPVAAMRTWRLSAPGRLLQAAIAGLVIICSAVIGFVVWSPQPDVEPTGDVVKMAERATNRRTVNVPAPRPAPPADVAEQRNDINGITKSSLDLFAAMIGRCESTMRKNDLAAYVSSSFLADPELVMGAQQSIKHFFAAVDVLKEDYDKQQQRMKTELDQATTTVNHRARALAQLNQFIDQIDGQFESLFQTYTATLEHLVELHEFMLKSDGQYFYSVDDENLTFEYETEQRHYENLRTQTEGLLAAAEGILSELASELRHGRGEFEDVQ